MQIEETILISMLKNTDVCLKGISELKAEHFYSVINQEIFRAIDANFSNGAPDLGLLSDVLSENAFLHVNSNFDEIAGILDITKHIEKLKNKYRIRMSEDVIVWFNQEKYSIDNSVEQLQNKILNIDSGQNAKIYSSGAIAKEFFEDLPKNKNAIYSGIKKLDNVTGGFLESDFIVLAARPKMGKTAFAMNIAVDNLKKGKSVMFVSLEMSRLQLFNRVLSLVANIPAHHIRDKTLSTADRQNINMHISEISEYKLHVSDTQGQTISTIYSNAMLCKKQHGLDLLIIDYLQLINGDRGQSTYDRVSEISRRCKEIAKALNIPVLALSQLSRKCEDGKPPYLPKLSHLRESGSIEQDIDMGIFLYRAKAYDTKCEHPNWCDVLVLANRHGPCDNVLCHFEDQYMRFSDIINEPEPDWRD